MKYLPGITYPINTPDPASSDCERLEAINDQFFKAFNVTLERVPGYSGPLGDGMSKQDKKRYLQCMKEAGMDPNKKDKFLLGEL